MIGVYSKSWGFLVMVIGNALKATQFFGFPVSLEEGSPCWFQLESSHEL